MPIVWHDADQKSGGANGDTLVLPAPDNIQAGDTLRVFLMAGPGVVEHDIQQYGVPPGWRIEFYRGNRAGGAAPSRAYISASKIATDDEPAEYTFTFDSTSTSLVMMGVIGRISSAAGTWARIRYATTFTAVVNSSNPAHTLPGLADVASGDYLRLFVGGANYFPGVTLTPLTVTSPAMTQLFQGVQNRTSTQGSYFSVYRDTQTGSTISDIDTHGGWDGSNTRRPNLSMYVMEEVEPAVNIGGWCPQSATDSESADPGAAGDFQPAEAPEYESQKNIEKIAYDPRTNTLLGSQGGFGTFGEEPPTTMKIMRSRDCGSTWEQVCDFGGFVGDNYWPRDGNLPEEDWESTTLYDTMFLPINLSPGVNPGDWIMMDFLGGYYISTDDGVTWSPRVYALLEDGVQHAGGTGTAVRYGGVIGGIGFFDTRAISLQKYQGGNTFGFVYTNVDESFATNDGEFLGVRRGRPLPGGGIEWDDSITPTFLEAGGANWGIGGLWPVVVGANGRWIAIVDYWSTQTWDDDFNDREVPQARINYSADLDPSAWGEPFWLVSKAWFEDMYEGTANHLSSFDRRFEFNQGHARLKFLPDPGHPAGGRWWLMGLLDTLLYSDDNGETWSRDLAYHPGLEENMHPILNWRASYSLGYRASRCRVLDIGPDPFDSSRLISIGITYNRPGITNRLAVFSCSTDGGNSWGPVGQLPIQLGRSGGDYQGDQPGRDSTSVARHIFPCLPPGE